MARIRTIKPPFWDDELIGPMSALTRLTFIGLFSQADDAGRMRASSAFVKAKLHAFDTDATPEAVERALIELHTAGRIRLYGTPKQRYLEVVNFNKHQYIRTPQPSELPAPGPNYPLLRIEGASEQAFTTALSHDDDSVVARNGMEWNGVDIAITSAEADPGVQLTVIDGSPLDKITTPSPRKATIKAEDDPQVQSCFAWYCEKWGKTGAFALTLTPKRARAIQKALKTHGREKVAAAILGHLTNDWRHEQLNRNDITVLLREENIDSGIELAARAAGVQPQGVAVTVGSDVEREGY